MSTYTTLIVLSGLVIFSYLFDMIASRIKLPSVLLLLFLGIGIKQAIVYSGYTPIDFFKILPTLGTLGLILIVFEGALELKYDSHKNSFIKKAFFSAFVILLLTAGSITFILHQLTGEAYHLCLINSIPFCVISSAIAIPSAAGISKEKKEFVVYESSFSDILGIILFNFVLYNHEINLTAFTELGIDTVLILSFAAISCLFLLYLIGRITHHIKFFLIISILILIYAIGQSYHLSALVIVLSFGLFLNNAEQIALPWFRKVFLYPKLSRDLTQLLQLSAESAFLMRTFFFILFGFTMNINQLKNIALVQSGLLILLAIYTIRFLYLKLVAKSDIMPELVLIPRGLISILLYYNLPVEMRIPGVETGLLFMVVLGTSIMMSGGLLLSDRVTPKTER